MSVAYERVHKLVVSVKEMDARFRRLKSYGATPRPPDEFVGMDLSVDEKTLCDTLTNEMICKLENLSRDYDIYLKTFEKKVRR